MEALPRRTSILVVEDEGIVALDMRGRLTEMGYSVVGIASSGEAALVLAAQEHPNLVLMDIKLQGAMDGVETAERLRKTLDVPIIFITAFADEETLSRAKIKQVFGYILKPFQEREVLISIEMALYKHRLEHDLQESKEWLGGTLNAISDSIIALDPEDRLVFVNHSAEGLLGACDGDLRGRPFDEVCSFEPDPSLTEIAALYRIKESSSGRDSQWLNMVAPAPRRPVEVIRTDILGPNGEIAGRVVAVREISDLVSAEATRSRLSAIVSNSYDAIVSLDADLRVLSWNLGAELIYGYSVEDMLGSEFTALIPEAEEQHQQRELVRSTLAGKHIGRFESHRRCRSGKTIAVSVSLSPLRDAAGRVSQIACIERDISAEKEYEASLVQAKLNAEEVSRVKSEFLSNMSHELRTPLNSIIGMVEMSRDISVSDEQREYLEIARQSADNLLFLITSILDFSKIEVGKMRLHSSVFDPVDAAEDCLEELSVQAFRKGLSLVFRAAPTVPTAVVGDSRRFKQILTNLLSNGVKFTERGRVRVELDLGAEGPAGVTLALRVLDTGIGIAEDRLGAIWESFTQLDGSSTRAFGGTGLGLSIVRSLSELMGGSVSVKSEVGVGSVFEAVLPFSVSKNEIPWSRPAVPVGATVLLAISSEEEVIIYDELLRSWGCTPVFYPSAVALLESLRSLGRAPAPRLVLIDDSLPDRSALFACEDDDRCRLSLQDRLVVLVPMGFREDPGWRSFSETTRFVFKPIRRKMLAEFLARGSTAAGGLPPTPGPGSPQRFEERRPQTRGEYPPGVLSELGAKLCSAVVDQFLCDAGKTLRSDLVRLEFVAASCRQELETLGAVDLPRIILKIILACRRDDPTAAWGEVEKLSALRSVQPGVIGEGRKP